MRHTEKELDHLIERLNKVTRNPIDTYIRDESTKGYKAQVGNYHLNHNGNGYSLEQMCENGGTTDTAIYGRYTKGQMYDLLQAFIGGIVTARYMED